MILKHKDLEIDPENPFKNCQLGRERYGIALTNILKSSSGGFVLAINNEWGTGKTTFIKMWQQLLSKNEYDTLYFNAWENDFDTSPLVAIISELKTLTTKESPSFKKFLKQAAVISNNFIPALVKAVADKYIGKDGVASIAESLAKAGTEILKDEIDEYTTKKQGLIEFRTALQEVIDSRKKDKPIVFFIDELDRCRPNYSVEVLEQIKHFFSVSGIVFVLSIDKKQLGNAVRGYYGSEFLDSDEYLRRFIDLEYILPAPSTKQFCGYLYKYFELDKFYETQRRLQFQEFRTDVSTLLTVASQLFESSNTNLRKQEKTFALIQIVTKALGTNTYSFPALLVMLVYIKQFHPDFYSNIVLRKLSYKDLLIEFEKIIPMNIPKHDLYIYLNMEADLLAMYYYSFPERYDLPPIQESVEGSTDYVSTVSSGLDPENKKFSGCLVQHERQYSHISLSHLTNKIDLTDNLEI